MCTFSEATQHIADSIREDAPLIGVISGIGLLFTAGVVAAVSARKTNDILDSHSDLLEDIKESAKNEEITVKEEKKKIAKAYGQCAWKMFRQFAPALAIAGLGTFLILKGYHVEHERFLEEHDKYISASAALATEIAAFKGYRERTRARFGDQVDNELMYDIKRETVEETVVDEKGKEKKVKKEVITTNVDNNDCSMYARWYNQENSWNWVNDSEMNEFNLEAYEREANRQLALNGKYTVNDLYNLLGFKDETGAPLRTKAGQVMGWVYDPEGTDTQIILGLDNEINADFRAHKTKNCLICVEPEGNIWELLDD